MLILVDIGNTSIKFGFAKNEKLINCINLPSSIENHNADSLGLLLLMALNHMQASKDTVEAFVVSSVVPVFDVIIKELAQKYFKAQVFIVGQNINVPLYNMYENPQEVGADRLVAAYAASQLHQGHSSYISVDFGTATTFDCVEENAYLGGLICPGILSSHHALSQKAAKLPRIALEVDAEKPSFGKNTALSISHGFVFGFAAMTEGLLTKLSDNFKSKPYVVATGGFAKDIAKHVPLINNVESNLILQGLMLLYNNKN